MSRTAPVNSAPIALWASAFVIAALVLLQAGRLPGNAAYADQASSSRDYTLLTTRSGLGGETDPDELLYIVDDRDQVMLVYQVEDARTGRVQLRDARKLDQLFGTARR
jgi:hypothetical protein